MFIKIVIFLISILAGLFLPSTAIGPNSSNIEAAPSSWKVKAIDTQIISKCWQNVSEESINNQVKMIKDLGVNYIAIGTPYDRPSDMKKWADAIHLAGLHVWFRSHWLAWEGDEGQSKNISPDEYLTKTKSFILENEGLFKEGDAFTVAVEAENAEVGTGKKFSSWDQYRQFLNDEIDVATDAFKELGLNNIYTNWLSMNGWVVENELNDQLVKKMGIITVDHYPDQDKNQTVSKLADAMSQDLDRFYNKWQVPILIGEWGYNLNKDVSDSEQSQYIKAMYTVIAGKSYIYGVNYWDHMGNNTRIINDKSGTDLSFRPAATIIQDFYNSK